MQRSAVVKTLPFLLPLVGTVYWNIAGGKSVAGSLKNNPAPSQTRSYNRVSKIHAFYTPVFSPTPTATHIFFLVSTVEPSLTPMPTLTKEHFISAIRGHRQYFPLGCEAAAAKDWANFFGYDFNEMVINRPLNIQYT